MDESAFEAGQWRRLDRGHLRAADAVAAVALALADAVVAGNLLKDRPGFTPSFPVSCALAVVLGAVVVARRGGPRRALPIAVAVSCAAAVTGVLWDPFAAVALVLYPLAVAWPARRSARALGWCLAAATASIWIGQTLHPRFGPVAAACWTAGAWGALAGAWLIGRLVRRRRWDAACLEAQRARRIVADERLRIARELHDVVTHGMGLIAVKAGIANHIADARPDEARDALRVIEATSRGALTEMRRLLEVLRQDDDTAPAAPAAPDLAALTELAERAGTAGVRVELTATGGYDLPEALRLTVHRIVQEALTNVVKHAAPTRCRATVTVAPGRVSVEVVDDGPGRPSAPAESGGHGLVGMRERVAMYGGTFEAAPRPGGGFAVAAVLPYGPGAVSAGDAG